MLPNELVKTRGFRMKIMPGEKGFTSTATVNVDLLGRSFVAKVNCDLVPESGIRLLETYKSVRIYTNSIDLVGCPPHFFLGINFISFAELWTKCFSLPASRFHFLCP